MAWTLIGGTAAAQDLEFPISPNPVGSGARAAGMGYAFVAVADDATAASWNPAGLVQLERPELSVVGDFNAITEKLHADSSIREFESTQEAHNLELNFLSVVYPLPWTLGGRNMTVSLNFQQKYDLSRSNDTTIASSFEFRRTLLESREADKFRQSGGLSAISPAFAIELNERLSVGVAVNFWRESPFGESAWRFQLDRAIQSSLNGTVTEDYTLRTHQEYRNLRGENFSLGLLWNVNDRLSIGARYDSHLLAKADFTRTIEDSRDAGGPKKTDEKRELSLPSAFALGAAYRFSDRLTTSIDVTTRDWNSFYVRTGSGSRISLVDVQDLDDPDSKTSYDRTVTVRAGAEYVFVPKKSPETLRALWSVRGGLFFDQEPASGRSTTDLSKPGDGSPDDFYGFSTGIGVQLFQRVNFDVGYELRYGSDVNSDTIRGVPGFNEDVIEHKLLVSAVVYF